MPGVEKALDVDDIIDRYSRGESHNTIARALGISRPTVKRRLDLAGVPTRSTSEAMYIRWSNMSPGERGNLVGPAHDSVRGMKRSEEDLQRRARGKERT